MQGSHITLCTSFKKRRCLASEGLVNLKRRELRSASTTRQDVIHYFTAPMFRPSNAIDKGQENEDATITA